MNTANNSTPRMALDDLAQYARVLPMMQVLPLAHNVNLVLRDMALLREAGDFTAAEGAFGVLTSSAMGLCAAQADSAEMADLKIAILGDLLPIYRHEHPLVAAIVEAAQQVERHQWRPN